MVRKTIARRTRTSKYSNNRSLPLRGNLYRKNKRRISFSKLFKIAFISVSFISIVFAILYGLFLYNKTNAENINQETVLKGLSQIMTLPNNTDLISVKRVSDAKNLISENDFYKNIALTNGDYIIVYKNTLIIYDFDKNHIKKIQTNIQNLNNY